jgi:hypothetical protein
MQRKSQNRGLGAAKAAKQDEFYTQYVDIQKEVESYLELDPATFRGKVVYCNCDDPFESNFFKYFAANFNKLGLKKLITTSYDGSPIAGAQLTFGEYDEGNGKRQKPKAIAVAWSFPLSANRADLLGEHLCVDKFPPKCSSKVDEKYTSASEQALGARISEREIGRHRGGWGQRAQAVR